MAEILDKDTSYTDEASNDKDLLATEQIREVTCYKCGGEEADCATRIQDLLVDDSDDPFPVHLHTKTSLKSWSGKQFSNHSNFISKVDREKKDEQAYKNPS